MGRHGACGDPPGIGEDASEVTLPRVADALRGLGFEPLERPDRVVVPAYSHIASFWVSYEKPLMLVGDCQQRIPVDFEYGTALARFLNTWNHDRVGPTASYRLTDSGDIDVHLRSGIRIKYGLSDEQLLQELADALEHMAAFSLQLRERFLPAGFDHPLPPTLSRAQDAEALLGRHPCERHLPRGGELDVGDVPDLYSPFDPAAGAGACRQVGIAEFEDAFDTLDFAYALTPEEVIATGVNGVPFAVCIDGEAYARVTSMWDSGRDPRSGFLPLWLMCNSVNEKSEGLRAYLHEMGDHLHVHVETTCLISAGLTPHQLDNYVLTSLVAVLGAVDAISTQSQGATVVNWPSAGQ